MLIPKELRDQIIISKYQAGVAIAEIMSAASLGCPNTLYKVLRAYDIPMRRPRDTNPLDALVGPLTYLLFDKGMEPAEAAQELQQPLDLILQVIDERL